MIPLWSIPYAILAGNTVVLKPSERAPTVVSILAECFQESSIPPGVLNIVHGSGTAVDQLLAQPTIRAVSFVGSDIVGERVCEHARATRKRVQAECSGKNHGVVMDDANKLKTLYAIVGSAFGAAGQRCMALSVVILVGDTTEWLQDLIDLAASLVVGPPLESGVDVGPVISAAAKIRIRGVIDNAEAEGADVVLDGRDIAVPNYPNGNFIGPTILSNVKPYMPCYQEEIFGPVLICMEAETMEEATNLVNNNRYGNGCTLFTGSPATAQLFQRSVNVGQIGINVPNLAPSGPVLRTTNKDSFLGDINVHGRGAWQFFTETKTVSTIWH
ncbi:Fc.00g115680.m01.CDS01 [Cosmosporella sp. VM-42]